MIKYLCILVDKMKNIDLKKKKSRKPFKKFINLLCVRL